MFLAHQLTRYKIRTLRLGRWIGEKEKHPFQGFESTKTEHMQV